jgi:hypothetical protein
MQQIKYETWISRQLIALELQIDKSQKVAEDLAQRLRWYRELERELVARGKAHVLGWPFVRLLSALARPSRMMSRP